VKHHNYHLYITTNPRKTVLYVGVTNDLERRLQEHLDDNMNDRKSFAGKYFCYNLVYYEWYHDVREAIRREKEIKGWTRAKKEKLIATFNPAWRFLNDPAEIEKGNLPTWYAGDEYWRPAADRLKKQQATGDASDNPSLSP
jgi:putative endonuclease